MFSNSVLCQDKKLNYNGSCFFKDQEEERKEIVANDFSSELWAPYHSLEYIINVLCTTSIFNADIRKKSPILLSSLS